MTVNTELRNRIFEILGPIYMSLDKEKLDDALKAIENAPVFEGDPGLWIRGERSHRLVTDLIKNTNLSDHNFTKWVIEHSTRSLGQRHEDLSGLRVLDVAIRSNCPQDLLNDLTIRTLEETNKLSKPYVYDLEKLPTYLLNDPGQIAESYVIHHRQFRQCLRDNLQIKERLQGQGIGTDFWEKELSYDDILKQIKPPEKKSGPEPGGSLMDLILEPQTKHRTHVPESAPTIDEYKNNNVLQSRLDRNVNAFLFRQQFDRVAAKAGAHTKKGRHHLMFSGPPGTGKTTLARVLGRHFKDIGLLEEGHVIETTATALIGTHVGHTADHVRKAVKAAKGGVLFIDEVYHFVKDKKFGPDAVNQLLALMENERESFILIVAGYKEDNDDFIALNPGTRDRFGDEFKFDHFSKSELKEILILNLEGKGLSMTDQAVETFLDYLEEDRSQNPHLYANARTLENLLEDVITQHAVSLNGQLNCSDFEASAKAQRKELLTLSKTSVNEAIRELKVVQPHKSSIGFELAPAGL